MFYRQNSLFVEGWGRVALRDERDVKFLLDGEPVTFRFRVPAVVAWLEYLNSPNLREVAHSACTSRKADFVGDNSCPCVVAHRSANGA